MARRKGIATTWWGKRWTGALESLGAVWRNRLPRGRTYAREGRVVGLTVESGRVTAYVVGRLPRPYDVAINLRPLTERQWRRVIAKLAERAGYAARLLAGEMPDDIEDAFAACNVSLFAQRPEDLKLTCTCPDQASPCKHVAATHYALGEAFDYDPFLLFALRGQDRDQVLAGLREARAAAVPARKHRAGGEERVKTPAEGEPPREIDPAKFACWRDEVAGVQFKIEPPAVRMAVLRSLGKPPGWREPTGLASVLDHVYDAAGALARRIALGEEGEVVGEDGEGT